MIIILETRFYKGLPSSRILNGGIVNVGDLPYAVSVATASGHVCGGFIYNEEWIVTSAYCVRRCIHMHY